MYENIIILNELMKNTFESQWEAGFSSESFIPASRV